MLTSPFPLNSSTSFRADIIKTSSTIFFTLRVAVPSSQPSVAVGSVSIHRISAVFEHVNGLVVRASSLIMPSSGPSVDGTSAMDDLTSLLKQLAQDRKQDQDRRESDRELRCQDDERLTTQLFEEMDRRDAAVREVASGATGERIGTTTSAGNVRGVSSRGSLPALGEAIGLPRGGASRSVDSHMAEVGSSEFEGLKQSVPKSSEMLPFSIGEGAHRGVCVRGWVYFFESRSA